MTTACKWKLDSDGNWETDCGETMYFEHAPPKEQGYIYCHHCGKPIEFIDYKPETDKEESTQ